MASIIDPKKYFVSIIAALIIIGVAVGSFVYGLLTLDSEEGKLVTEEIRVEISDKGMTAIPSGNSFPTHAPSVPVPTNLP